MRSLFNTILRWDLIGPEQTVLVAVSGGADSVALLHALHALAPRRWLRLIVAHLHHGIRGRSADEDAAFVRRLARALRLRCVVGRADVPALAKRRAISLEMAAREARYAFLARTARRVGADVIALAHTADDQAETVLLKLLRGAGLEGLSGMPPVTEVQGIRVIRPLLEVTRAGILAYLQQRGLAWREDESNRDTTILRNRVRHELLPLLEQRFNPRIREVLCRTSRILAEEDAWCQAEAERILAQCTLPAMADHAVGLDVAQLREHHVAMRRRVLRSWLRQAGVAEELLDFAAVERLDRLLQVRHGSGRVELGAWTVWREYERLCLRRGTALHPGGLPQPVRIRMPGKTPLPELGLTVRAWLAPGWVRDPARRPGVFPARASLSLQAWRRRRLVVRGWRPGDRMRPLGMRGSKKLQDILVDAKIPRAERHAIPVFECGGEIVWLPGYRIAQGWEVSDPSTPALQLAVERR